MEHIIKKYVSFFNDDTASIEIPIRLVVYVILTASIIAVTMTGLTHIWPGITTNIMEKQMEDTKTSLSAMQYGASRNIIDPDSPAGNIRTLVITIPEDVEYIAFGADPDPDNDHNLTNTPGGLVTERGNVIYYSSGTGGKVRIPLDDNIELREGKFENGRWFVNTEDDHQSGTIISGKGNHELTFELVYDPVAKERYTLVHTTDDINAYINPYDPSVLPNNLWISVYPVSIPPDGITDAQITVRLKDKQGRDAMKDGVNIHLFASTGNLSASNLTTVKGKAAAAINSDIAGTSIITATSPGLNPGSVHLTIIQEPIILGFDKWILSEDDVLNEQFFTNRELNLTCSFTGYGTKFQVPLIGVYWPNASIEIDGIQLGEETIDSESSITRTFIPVTLPAGYHDLNITLKNDKYLPVLGDTNLYVEKVELS